MKTPDEIKKGLEKCSNAISVCDECVFSNDNAGKWKELMGDALAYIQQLERERNVLINALRHGIVCKVCKHYGKKMNEEPCGWCGSHHDCFEWRGAQEGDQ